jgi:hypothetical protein
VLKVVRGFPVHKRDAEFTVVIPKIFHSESHFSIISSFGETMHFLVGQTILVSQQIPLQTSRFQTHEQNSYPLLLLFTISSQFAMRTVASPGIKLPGNLSSGR